MLASPSLAVIPAKAGVLGALMPKAKMDSRFLGDDGEKGAIIKDTY